MTVPVLCLHAAGGPFADLGFLAKADVFGSSWRDAVTGNTAGAAKCRSRSFRMSAAGVDGLPLGICARNLLRFAHSNAALGWRNWPDLLDITRDITCLAGI